MQEAVGSSPSISILVKQRVPRFLGARCFVMPFLVLRPAPKAPAAVLQMLAAEKLYRLSKNHPRTLPHAKPQNALPEKTCRLF